MAEESKTKNLGLPLILGSDYVMKDKINDAIKTIDEVTLSKDHENSKAHFAMWQPNTKYKKQDVVRTPTCPSWGFYMCSTAGMSGSAEPQGYGEGDVIVDGTVTWVLKLLGGTANINHSDLIGRNLVDQHSISAITGLQALLDTLITAADAKIYTDTKITDLIDDAPEALNTLKKIADALTDDDNAISAIMAILDDKVDKVPGKGLSENNYDKTDKTKVSKIGQTVDGRLTYNGLPVFEDIRTVVFVGGSTEIVYPFNGTIQKIAVICSEPQVSNLTFNVEMQTKADYLAQADNWNLVSGIVLTLTANSSYQEYTNLANTNLKIATGDVIRASTAGDDTGVVFHVTVKNN